MFDSLDLSKAKPLLRLTDEERKRFIELFFSSRYQAPVFRADTDERKRQLCEQFLTTILKVPVFWYYEEYDHGVMRGSIDGWVNIVCSTGETIREMQTPRADCTVTITDQCDSYAIIELAESGPIIHSVVFNPRSQW